jgi:hypothetical protein
MRRLMRLPGLNKAALLLGTALFFGACGGSPGTTNEPAPSSASTAPTAQPSPLTPFEKDLQFIRNGQYTYVWVFSRKDGKALDGKDSEFLRSNAPQVVDWVTTDEGKKVIGGTNFDLEQGNMEKLKKRFVVEDYTGK